MPQKSFKVPFGQTQPELGKVLQSTEATIPQTTDTEMRWHWKGMTMLSYVFSANGQLAIRGDIHFNQRSSREDSCYHPR